MKAWALPLLLAPWIACINSAYLATVASSQEHRLTCFPLKLTQPGECSSLHSFKRRLFLCSVIKSDKNPKPGNKNEPKPQVLIQHPQIQGCPESEYCQWLRVKTPDPTPPFYPPASGSWTHIRTHFCYAPEINFYFLYAGYAYSPGNIIKPLVFPVSDGPIAILCASLSCCHILR